jgi:hypothetical protein
MQNKKIIGFVLASSLVAAFTLTSAAKADDSSLITSAVNAPRNLTASHAARIWHRHHHRIAQRHVTGTHVAAAVAKPAAPAPLPHPVAVVTQVSATPASASDCFWCGRRVFVSGLTF